MAVARLGHRVRLSPQSRRRIIRNRKTLSTLLKDGSALYGVNTGFGRLARTRISGADLSRLQLNLIRSHAAGVGNPLSKEVVRAILFLRSASLSKGYSGVRPQLVTGFLSLLNADIIPVVPSRGSVGASGDLAPLAHVTLALLGEGKVIARGRPSSARNALKGAGLAPMKLMEKEGLASINGTQALTAVGLITLWDAYQLWETALAAGALSTESVMGSDVPFSKIFGKVRSHPGHEEAAFRLRGYLRGSAIVRSHAECDRVQDPYSFRCQPQVMGAVKDTMDFVKDVLVIEINAVTDNPLVDSETRDVISGGNFHGQPVAMALDFLTQALVTLTNISERRIAALMDPVMSGLPAFLGANPGRDSGLMIWQVTAAALASESKMQSMPASCDTIPTSANQEDFVSMGMGAALKAADTLERAQQVVAIELMAGRFGVDHHRPLKLGAKLRPIYESIAAVVPAMQSDRNFQSDFNATVKLLREGIPGLPKSPSW